MGDSDEVVPVRVVVALEQDEDGYPPYAEEGLWARALGPGVAEIVSVPFFVVGLSKGDFVAHENTPDDGPGDAAFIVRLSARGHSTLRVIMHESSATDDLCNGLTELGCGVERSPMPSLIAVDIPPSVGYRRVEAFLAGGHASELWEYEVSCLSREHAASSIG